jgi:hypothetical protein
MKLKGVPMLAVIAILSLPLYATADMFDVLTVKLNKKCSLEQLNQLNDDFNAYGKDKGGAEYELLLPLHSPDQDVIFIVGRFASVEAFGKVEDTFNAEMKQDGSEASNLYQRANKCVTLTNRASAVTVK